jgi:hypothetical protein
MEADIKQPGVQSLLQLVRCRKTWLFIGCASGLGALLAALDGAGRFLNGWLAYSLVSALAFGLLLAAVRLSGASRAGKAAWTAFILRLAVGVFLFLILPAAGYPDNRATQAGYPFDDAYVRDQQAWKLAVSDTPLVSAFSGSFEGDQYGGMLALSYQMPFVLIYGITRPVLPAALGDKESVVLIWRVINILRAAGWYALALPLVYGLFSVWRSQIPSRRSQIVWLFIVAWGWILISSAVAGGDMWDNPRYRTIFLVIHAVLAGWALNWAITQKDPWLMRWFYVELSAVGALTVWYISRNYISWLTLDIWTVLGLIVGLSAWILIRGWRSDRNSRHSVHAQKLG